MRITIPDIGVEHASVAEILVKVGDVVTAEQSLLLLESDKAAVEVPSPQAGRIAAILLNVGAQVAQGDAAFELVADDAAQQTASTTHAAQQARLDLDDVATSSSAASSARVTAAPTPSSTQAAAKAATDNTHNSNDATATVDVQVPDMGVEKAVVSEILVQVGDVIASEQSLVLLESDKASVEVPSPMAGTVAAIMIQTGDSVKEGVVLLQLSISNTNASDAATSSSAVLMPSADQTGNNAAQDKTQSQTHSETQASADAQTLISHVQNQSDDASTHLTEADQSDNALVHAGPAVRQLARQLGVPLREVNATGAHARIVKEDVFAYVKTRLAAPVAAPSSNNAPQHALPALPNFDAFGGGEWQKLSRLQQVSIPQLSLNNYIPQVTQFDLADITELEAWRESLKADYKNQGISLTILAFIVKAVAHLLKKEPYFAAHLADDAQSVLLRHEIHMGIAVATPDGLTVPVLRHPEQKSIAQIASELMDLSQKARDKKLSPKDLQGANFSITSLGSIGGTAFTPLVNWPQVAILGISPARLQPMWDGAQFVPRLMLPLSLSYDHRVINGADAASFSHQLTLILKDIRQILL